jgi:hypothetical protein
VALLVIKNTLGPEKDWPKELPGLLTGIIPVANKISSTLGLPSSPWQYIRKLLGMKKDDALPDGFPDEIKNNYLGDPRDPNVLAPAFRRDLLQFFEQVRPEAERDKAKLLLLIDDVHRMGPAAGLLLNDLLGPSGLLERRAKALVRGVFTYSSVAVPGQEMAVAAIIDWRRSSEKWAKNLLLDRFQSPVEDRLAYEHYLLHWKDETEKEPEKRLKPLAVTQSPDENVQKMVQSFFNSLSQEVNGVPSYLQRASPVIRTLLRFPMPHGVKLLCEANDEDALKEIRQPGG